MVSYAIASARSTDGAENRVVLNGIPGFFGYTVHLEYLEDGFIKLTGNNTEESNGWKLLSQFPLEPGTYTLTGMKGVVKDTIALQLHVIDDSGSYRYIYQYDEDAVFTIEQQSEATLHAMVYPFAENIDVVARPAVYKEGGAV